MKWFIILSLLLIGFILFIWSIANHNHEKKSGLKHDYGILILSIILLIITIGYIFVFISKLPNATY